MLLRYRSSKKKEKCPQDPVTQQENREILTCRTSQNTTFQTLAPNTSPSSANTGLCRKTPQNANDLLQKRK